jgi:hypothetical protein
MLNWRKSMLAAGTAALLLPSLAFAFSPIWTMENPTPIKDVTDASAYFGTLAGEPQVFTFELSDPTPVYFSVLTPDLESSKKDISAALVDVASPDIPLGVVIGAGASWSPFLYEGDRFLRGPEFRATVPAGAYELIVWSSNNDSAYGLIVGEDEPFILSRIAASYAALPKIKSAFFGESALAAFHSPIILYPLIALLVIVVLAIAAVRWRRRAPRSL